MVEEEYAKYRLEIVYALSIQTFEVPEVLNEPHYENLFLPYATNKGADQPAHLRSLISAFIVRCLDSILSLVSISEISSL